MSAIAATKEIVYPESDGQPMAENMAQYHKIVLLREDLHILLPGDLVAADNFIYGKKGFPKIVQAPDVYVALGRPPGDRPSYQVWEEEDIFPQVIFEILSPGNRAVEMTRKFLFYEEYGAEEYYVYDPLEETVSIWLRNGRGRLIEVPEVNGFKSPLLGFSIRTTGDEVQFFNPDGSPFLSFPELKERSDREAARADAEQRRADAEQRRADAEKQRADELVEQLALLQAKLKAAGLNGS
jgi:hypothetical protein